MFCFFKPVFKLAMPRTPWREHPGETRTHVLRARFLAIQTQAHWTEPGLLSRVRND